MLWNKTWVATVALAISFASSSFAGTLVDFKPLPVSPTNPEFVFSRALGGGVPVFRAGSGAIGNADGTLPLVNQTPGGLLAEVPLIIPGIPGSQLSATSTLFFDTTLEFPAGLAANAPAINAGGAFIQQLSPGTFNMFSTDPDGPGPLLPTLLLSGNINTASFIVGTGNSGAEFNASGVNYTGGVILTALVSSGGSASGNSMSISMVDVTPNFGIAGDGYLADFATNATGLFNGSTGNIPEPSSLVLLAVAFGGVVGIRRRSA